MPAGEATAVRDAICVDWFVSVLLPLGLLFVCRLEAAEALVLSRLA